MKKNLFLVLALISTTFLYAQELTTRALVKAVEHTILSSEIAGKIVSIPKSNGQSFKKGETLVKIDCTIYKAQLEKVKSQVDIAREKMLKNQQLSKYNSGSIFELQISELEYKKELAEFNIAKINTKRCQIRAPYNGKIVKKIASKYQNIQPNQELLEILNTSNLELEVIVPSSWLTFLKKDQKFKLLIDETQEELEASIQDLGAMIDTSSQTISLRAKPISPYDTLIPGMSATAEFKRP